MIQYIVSSLLVLLPITAFNPVNAKIVINEVMSSNAHVLLDEDGDYPDWVELYNSGELAVDLYGWILTDDSNEKKWIFPPVSLPPDNYIIVFCSGKNRKTGVNLHTNFKLNSEGEDIFLIDSYGGINDKIERLHMPVDMSVGRSPDAGTNLAIFLNPSPGTTNNNSINLNPIEFSHNPGFYLNRFDLSIFNIFPDDEIFYTLDGSIPTENSLLYEGPISIKNRNGQSNIFSSIMTNPVDTPDDYRWKPPNSEVYKATVVRAAAYRNGIRTSKVITASYFVDPAIYDKYTFPIVSITTDSLNLFGYSEGIYVPGRIHDEKPDTVWYWGSGNYHQRGEEWERPVHIELIETSGKISISQDAGIRIHGTGSRALPEKSMKLYARSEYGKSIFDYQIFPDKNKKDFKRFVLSNSGQDFGRTMFADALIQDITKNSGIEFQSWRPAIVFINGEYWGIHNIRDRYDEFYLKDYCSEEPENIELLVPPLDLMPSASSYYDEMVNFILTHDLSDDVNYEVVSQYIDINNFINYNIQKIFLAVTDWPGNNVMIWRPKYTGGKFRWLSFDNDDGMMYTSFNSIEHVTADTSSDWRNPPQSTFLFRNMIKNKTFREKFLSMFELKMKNIFLPENIINKINKFQQTFEPEIDEHIARWGYPASKENWLAFIESMRKFAVERPDIISKYINEYFLHYISVNENNIDDFQFINIYPNPSQGEFSIVILNGNIILNEVKNLNSSYCDLTITDALGREIYCRYEKDFDESGIIKCELTGIPAGIYFLNVNINNQVYTQKLIIAK